jgi:hypothetical protein
MCIFLRYFDTWRFTAASGAGRVRRVEAAERRVEPERVAEDLLRVLAALRFGAGRLRVFWVYWRGIRAIIIAQTVEVQLTPVNYSLPQQFERGHALPQPKIKPASSSECGAAVAIFSRSE